MLKDKDMFIDQYFAPPRSKCSGTTNGVPSQSVHCGVKLPDNREWDWCLIIARYQRVPCEIVGFITHNGNSMMEGLIQNLSLLL